MNNPRCNRGARIGQFAKNPKGLNMNNPRCNRGARIGQFAKNPKGLNMNNPRCIRGARIGQFTKNPKGLNFSVIFVIITFKPFGFVASVPAHCPRLHRGLFTFKPFGFFATIIVRLWYQTLLRTTFIQRYFFQIYYERYTI